MNFLKSVLSGTGSGFPGYAIHDEVDLPVGSLFTLNNATRREDNSQCSVLIFETIKAPTLLPLARNYHSKLRSLKHPGIVKYLDSLEVEGFIYIATERVSPLRHTLLRSPKSETISWGLYTVAQSITFINTEATSIHGNIRTNSIFTTDSGEWKVAGFEALTCMKDEEPFILKYGGLVPDTYKFTPPELQNKGFGELRNTSLTSLDSWQFAGLIWTLYNGEFSSASSLQGQGKIPNNMYAQYRRLLSPNPQSRLSVSNFLDFGRRPACFFRTDLIEISEMVPSLPMKPRDEVEAFLDHNMQTIAALPAGFRRNKLLPELAKSFEFGDGGPVVLKNMLALAQDLDPADVELLVVPVLLRIWSSKDRATQLILLENLKDYISIFSTKQINDKLFQCVGSCFTDPAPIMRETAIRQVLILTPHLSDRNINEDLLKYLAKTANDQQPGIRTNTTICLGKISSHLNPANRRKVLTAAFSRSLKDPFTHARLAALQAINATSDIYDKEDLANRIMPATVTLLIDAQRDVREQAKKTLTVLLARIESLTSDMPDIVASTAEGPTTSTTTGASTNGPAVSGAIETAAVWAGWAVTALSRNIDSSSPGPGSTSASLPVTRSVTPSTTFPPQKQGTVVAKLKGDRPQTARASSSTGAGGLKLAAKPKKVDVLAIYTEDFGSGEDAWGADAWNEPVVHTTTGTDMGFTSQGPKLTKPLAKSTAKILPLVQTRKTAEKMAEEDEWDTDAW